MKSTRKRNENVSGTFCTKYILSAGLTFAITLAALLFTFGSAASSASAQTSSSNPSILCSANDYWCNQSLISSIIPGATVTNR